MSGLGQHGKGAPAFKLTSNVVSNGVYGWVRNPMALGFYLATLDGALLAGSTYMLLYTAIGVISMHLLNLKFFEELELSLRYGDSYEAYRSSTPFLIPRLVKR
jgi:protein-S-isoprenylcysteine O-methyltransferase Ste14